MKEENDADALCVELNQYLGARHPNLIARVWANGRTRNGVHEEFWAVEIVSKPYADLETIPIGSGRICDEASCEICPHKEICKVQTEDR